MNDQDYQKLQFAVEGLSMRMSQLALLISPLAKKIEELEKRLNTQEA